MEMAREMEIELQRTRDAIQKHAEEMIGLLLELETRLEDRLTQAQARIGELKSSTLTVQADTSDSDLDDNDDTSALAVDLKSGDALFAVANHQGTNSNNGTNHITAT